MTRAAHTLIVVGVAVFVVGLAVRAPATLVAGTIAGAAPGLAVDGVSGSAWRGHATSTTWRGVRLGALEWRLSAANLLRARTSVRIELAGGEATIHGRVDRTMLTGRLQVSGLNGNMPLPLLASIAGATGPLDASIAAEDVSLAMRRGVPLAAAGIVTLSDTTVLQPQRYPLGDFRLALDVDGEWLRGTITDATGPIALDGAVRVSGDRRWDLDARVRARERDRNLEMVLSLLGDADAEGYRRLQLSGIL